MSNYIPSPTHINTLIKEERKPKLMLTKLEERIADGLYIFQFPVVNENHLKLQVS